MMRQPPRRHTSLQLQAPSSAAPATCVAKVVEVPRRHEAVAAVVARARHNQHARVGAAASPDSRDALPEAKGVCAAADKGR